MKKTVYKNISIPLCFSKLLKTHNGCNAQPSHLNNGSKTQFSNIGIYLPALAGFSWTEAKSLAGLIGLASLQVTLQGFVNSHFHFLFHPRRSSNWACCNKSYSVLPPYCWGWGSMGLLVLSPHFHQHPALHMGSQVQHTSIKIRIANDLKPF